MDGSTLFSRRLFKRKIKVHPQQKKCTEINTNTRSRGSIAETLKEQQSPKYISYEDIDFPSHQSSLTQLHPNNTQESTNEGSTNAISCDMSNVIQRDVLEGAELDEVTAQGGSKGKGNCGEWFEEIKKMCFSLVGKINVFKMIKTRNRIAKDHWKEDSTTRCCSFCHRKFTAFFRKHHCRICGNIYCSTCSSGRTLLDPNLAMPIQFVTASTLNENLKYDRNSGEFAFDGFEYNYLDYEEVDHGQKQLDRDHEHYWDQEQEQRQKHKFEYDLGQGYDQECLYSHDYEHEQHEQYRLEQEFDEHYTNDYFSDEYSITNSSDYSSDSSSLVDFNVTTRDLIYDEDSSTVINNEEAASNKVKIYYGSEPVRERVCINCHKVYELDENDWCCD